MTTCRFPDCKATVAEGMARCEEHRLRWFPGRSPEPVPMSPFTRRALDRKLPAKVFG